MAKPLTNSKHN